MRYNFMPWLTHRTHEAGPADPGSKLCDFVWFCVFVCLRVCEGLRSCVLLWCVLLCVVGVWMVMSVCVRHDRRHLMSSCVIALLSPAQ